MSADATIDWRSAPLAGRVLIEASAGTGKTYTIGLIYLRLVLERGLRVEQIMVATFTERAFSACSTMLRWSKPSSPNAKSRRARAASVA